MVLISRELRSLIDSNSNNINVTMRDTNIFEGNMVQTSNLSPKKNLVLAYLKRRALGIIYLVVVLMLLVTSSIFTDLGFNIGQLILNGLKSFLGF